MNSSSSNGLKVPFGRKRDRLVAPTEVAENGLDCECVCPGCKARLMIRQGTKRRHFAHYNAAGSERCVQISIHSAAIQVLLDHQYLQVPEKIVRVVGRAKGCRTVELSRELTAARIVRFNKCLPEVTMTGANSSVIRPDVIGYRGDRQMLIEMCFTHAVDAEKQQKIAAHGHAAIEIDLADLEQDQGFEAVRKRVVEEAGYKEWIYVPREDEIRAELMADLEIEIDALNRKYDEEQELIRRKYEAERAREIRRKQADDEWREQHQAQATPEQRVYRQTSVPEREQQMRKALGLYGPWPNYLRLYNKHNYAIDAPFQLWQSAAFHRFIFKKPIFTTTLFITDVAQWVLDWFGPAPGSNRNARIAIETFLNYLKGCGFLKKVRSPDGAKAFIVIHNGIAPPDQEDAKGQSINLTHREHAAAIRNFQISLTWKPLWPERDLVYAAISKSDESAKDVQIKMLEWLYKQKPQFPTPLDFALSMRGYGLSSTEVLEFLRMNGFVE